MKEINKFPIDIKELPKYLEESFKDSIGYNFKKLEEVSETKLAFLLGQQSIITHIKERVEREFK